MDGAAVSAELSPIHVEDSIVQGDAIIVEGGEVLDDSEDVDFVMDSLAGDTFVEDSQDDFSKIEVDAASSLMHLQATEVSTFQRDWAIDNVSKSMFPHWYGLKDQNINYAVSNLVWLSHGQTASTIVVDDEDLGGQTFEIGIQKFGMVLAVDLEQGGRLYLNFGCRRDLFHRGKEGTIRP